MFAPIVLFCYKRCDVLKKAIEALLKNSLSSESELYIFSDGYKNEKDKQAVEEVRKYLRSITGFKNITIIEAQKNKGLARSVIDGVTEIINKYGKIIVIEDDVLVNPYFLEIVNKALDMYENEEKVSCISGFSYPIDINEQSYFVKGAECAVWATWKRAWDVFEEDGQKLLNEIKNRKLQTDFNFNNTYPYVNMLENQIIGKVDSWAIRWYASCYLKNMLCLYFKNSLNINLGFGNSEATNCSGECDWYNKGYSDQNINLEKIKIQESRTARKLFIKFFKKTFSYKKGMFLFSKEKIGNKKIITILGFIKFSYNKKRKSNEKNIL